MITFNQSKEFLDDSKWRTYLKELFPETLPYVDASIGIHLTNDQIVLGQWYKSGEVILGYFSQTYYGSKPYSIRPYFITLLVIDNVVEYGFNWVFNLEKPDNDMDFIKALADHSLLPLCIPIDWAKDFLSAYFSKSKELVTQLHNNIQSVIMQNRC